MTSKLARKFCYHSRNDICYNVRVQKTKRRRRRHLVFAAITSKQSAKQTIKHEVRVCECGIIILLMKALTALPGEMKALTALPGEMKALTALPGWGQTLIPKK